MEICKNHLSLCPRCLAVVAAGSEGLAQEPIEPPDQVVFERSLEALIHGLRCTKGRALVDHFRHIVERSQGDTRDRLVALQGNVANIIGDSFRFPLTLPRWEPVQAPTGPLLLSPLGKVRFPLRFELEPETKGYRCELLAGTSPQRLDTQDLGGSLAAADSAWLPGSEVFWMLVEWRGDAKVGSTHGSFVVATQEEADKLNELETLFKNIDQPVEELSLWGCICEAQGFFDEAIQSYRKTYSASVKAGSPSVESAYRIACCYDHLGAGPLRDRWSHRVRVAEAMRRPAQGRDHV